MQILSTTSPKIKNQTLNTTNYGSLFSGIVNTITTHLISILSTDKQTELQEKNERMKVLLEQLREAVKSRSDMIDYNYDLDNYLDRLCQDNEVLKTTLYVSVLTLDIKNLYGEIVSLFGNDKKSKIVFESKLYKEYLEDLVYESINEYNLKEYVNLEILDLSGDETYNELLNIIKKLHQESKLLDLGTSLLQNYTGIELLNIIKSLPIGLKYLCLSDNKLGDYTGVELLKIINHLPPRLIGLELGYNNLGNYTGIELLDIIKNLPSELKFLYLGFNNLGNYTGIELLDIIKNLPLGLKNLILCGNNLGKYTGIELINIIKNLPSGLNDLDLSRNNLGNYTGIELLDIIKNLPSGLISLNLFNNNISKKQKSYIKLSLPNIKIIF